MSYISGPLGSFARRLLATVLGLESLVVFFGALVSRGLSDEGADLFVPMTVLAVACAVAAGLMRRPFGLALGWVLQALILVSGAFVPAMLVIGLVFVGLWVLCLVQGNRIDAEVAARQRHAPHDLR